MLRGGGEEEEKETVGTVKRGWGVHDPLDYAHELSLKGGTKKNAMRRTKSKT